MYCRYTWLGRSAYSRQGRNFWRPNWIDAIILAHANLSAAKTKQVSVICRSHLFSKSDSKCFRRTDWRAFARNYRENGNDNKTKSVQGAICVAWNSDFIDFPCRTVNCALLRATVWGHSGSGEERRCADKKGEHWCCLRADCNHKRTYCALSSSNTHAADAAAVTQSQTCQRSDYWDNQDS